ncbi:MAG TPA: ABC-F family ATP-binding cassette domain-containing protein [Anaeromyxobacteraceae bacterium]|nr:ABC-F family ATP-binding cassette domain-containing protein [Anaeromyxobacteraceae bacterium]
MSLVTASGLWLAFGDAVLFQDASLSIGPRDRVGLVGPNGTGKSSLLRILAGERAPDAGALAWRRGARAGYLPQDVTAIPPGPVIDTVLASVPGRAALEARLAAVEAALPAAGDEGDQLELSQALADLHAELDHFEEHFGRARAERLLTGLGFRPEDLGRDTRTLAGGWRMRAALAGLLLQDPDLLLLDEPTNHLDVPTLQWFDAFLRGTRKALVLVSHDRVFLDRQIDRVLSLEPEGLRSWAGNYGDYRRQRAEEEARLVAEARRQASRRAELEAFIERFGAKNTKAAQARSKRKMLERMEAVEVREERATLAFSFPEAPRSGREVLRLEGVGKAFGATTVYRGLEARVLRGERVAVIGPNGAGKSTLLKLAAGELAPDAGRVVLGHGVVAGYYAQHHFDRDEHAPDSARSFGTLDPGKTVVETLWEVVPDRGEAFVRSVAGGFLFSGDDADKAVGVLSGGERARVALAKLLLRPANLLLLDEPTNHLDLESAEALTEALAGYRGTLLFVSHDLGFANRLATAVWEVKGGGVVPFPGNVDDWLYHQRQLEAASGLGAEARAPEAPGRDGERERRRAEAEARNARYRREKPIRDEIARLEERIAGLEAEERAATLALADPATYQDFARARPHLETQRRARAELEGLYARWEAQQALLQQTGQES